MRAFVLVEPKFLTPPEIFPTLLEGFAAWRDTNREHMESFEFFAGGGGGFGIFNGPDEATLNRIMVQYPFFPLQLDNGSPHTRRGYCVGAVARNHERGDGRGPCSVGESLGEHQLSA